MALLVAFVTILEPVEVLEVLFLPVTLEVLLITFVYLLCRRVITFKEASGCITKGFLAMVPAMLILTFALTLKNMTGLLGAADYVAGLVEGAAAGPFSASSRSPPARAGAPSAS